MITKCVKFWTTETIVQSRDIALSYSEYPFDLQLTASYSGSFKLDSEF
jgi:hypothetical protein